MLVAAVLIAGLFGGSKLVTPAPGAGCPAAPVGAFVTSEKSCPALEVSGRVDGSSATIDPAFDVFVQPAELARIAAGDAVLSGYSGDGRTLFTLPIATGGTFHVYVPLAAGAQQALTRLTLSAGTARAERTGTPAIDAAAELISISDQRVIVAWNAAAFPAIRVGESTDRPAIGAGSGTGTFEQMSVDTRSRRLYIMFSNGVRSVVRGFTIFGR